VQKNNWIYYAIKLNRITLCSWTSGRQVKTPDSSADRRRKSVTFYVGWAIERWRTGTFNTTLFRCNDQRWSFPKLFTCLIHVKQHFICRKKGVTILSIQAPVTPVEHRSTECQKRERMATNISLHSRLEGPERAPAEKRVLVHSKLLCLKNASPG